MAIKLVVFDADKTLWSHPDVSSLALPFKLSNKNVISDVNGKTFYLFNGIRELLSELQTRNVIITLASWNKPQSVKETLQLFGIDKFFKFMKAESHQNKHLMIKDTFFKLSREGIKLKPEEILYVDDRTCHLDQIMKGVGPLHFVQMWVDAKTPNDILEYIEKYREK